MDPTKSVRFQGRFAFVLSYAYNRVERNPERLAAAKTTIDFFERTCFDARGRMDFEVASALPPHFRRAPAAASFHSATSEATQGGQAACARGGRWV